MNRKVLVMGALLLTQFATTTAPAFAETGKETARIEKLEERTRELEARMAQIEASMQKQATKMMEHGMMGKGMQPDGAMGQMPQPVVPQGGVAPGGSMPQGGAMPPGGMGDM